MLILNKRLSLEIGFYSALSVAVEAMLNEMWVMERAMDSGYGFEVATEPKLSLDRTVGMRNQKQGSRAQAAVLATPMLSEDVP